MKRHWLLTALGAILAGAGLHFLWQALPNPLFALISPVNESVWEHLKLPVSYTHLTLPTKA